MAGRPFRCSRCRLGNPAVAGRLGYLAQPFELVVVQSGQRCYPIWWVPHGKQFDDCVTHLQFSVGDLLRRVIPAPSGDFECGAQTEFERILILPRLVRFRLPSTGDHLGLSML